MNHRRAKKKRIGFYKELGYVIKWRCVAGTGDSDDFWDSFIGIVEKNNLFVGGCFHQDGGEVVVEAGKYKSVTPQTLQHLLGELSQLKQITGIEYSEQFDLNKGKDPAVFTAFSQ